MTTREDIPVARDEPPTNAPDRVGLYSAVSMALLTAVIFGLAITALPNAGAGCTEDCVGYSYLDTLSEFPGDYLWMPPAMILVLAYVVLVVSIRACAPGPKEIHSRVGQSFALLAAGVLLVDYYVQFFVVPRASRMGRRRASRC